MLLSRLIDHSTSKREVERCLEAAMPAAVPLLGSEPPPVQQAAVRFVQNSIGDSKEGDKMVNGWGKSHFPTSVFIY